MRDRAGLWIVRGVLAAMAAGLLWWGASALDLGGSLQSAADAHSVERHGGAANKVSASEDVLSELSHVFGRGAVFLGVVCAVAAVFPYRRFSRKAATG